MSSHQGSQKVCDTYRGWRRFGCRRLAQVPLEQLRRKVNDDGELEYDERAMLESCLEGRCHYEVSSHD